MNFVGRVSRDKSHLLLKSTIWTIIYEQFFSAPFGFGAIGPGKGLAKLMHAYCASRELLDRTVEEGLTISQIESSIRPTKIRSPASNEKEVFSAFYCDQVANNWRSATFQSVSAELKSGDDYLSALESPLAKLSADNVNHTVSRILGFLSDVARLSNSNVSRDVEEQISTIANLAMNISLQFGINPAQLRLSVPNRGEQMRIGEEYHHCENADLNAGSVCMVDLVILPGLLKIGNGRSDMSSKGSLYHAKSTPSVYPNDIRDAAILSLHQEVNWGGFFFFLALHRRSNFIAIKVPVATKNSKR